MGDPHHADRRVCYAVAVQLLAPEEVGKGVPLNSAVSIKSLLVYAMLLNAVVNGAYAGSSERQYDPALLEQGRSIFADNCSVCHGSNAEGEVENWHQRDDAGNLPAPPLNGTAHTWHHSIAALFHTIKNGTESIGGTMPAWKDSLSDDEIFSVIVWITSLWPDEIYDAWIERSQN